MSQPSARESTLTFLDGYTPDAPVCMQTYLGLYLEDRRREALVDIYREMLGEADEVEVIPEQVLSAELDAWQRAWDALRTPPAWMLMRIPHPPSSPATVRRDGQRLMWRVGDGPERDLTDATSSSDRDVWDRRADPRFDPDPVTLIPVWEPDSSYLLIEAATVMRANARWGSRYLLHGHMGMPYWACYSALGFAGLMESMHSDGKLLDALIERATHNALQRVKLTVESGIECLFIEECLCSSDMISEQDYLRYSYPAAEAVLHAARAAGLRTVYYFCGGVEGRLKHLARLPAHALAFEEGKKDFEIDIGRVRNAVGVLRPLLGNIDVTALRDADAEGIGRLVAQQMRDAGPMLATSCGSPLTLDTPAWKLDAMVEATATG